MCGRTSLYVDPATLEDRFDATIDFEYELPYNIAPRQNLATIRDVNQNAIVEQEWGLLAPWADDPDDGPMSSSRRGRGVRGEVLSDKSVSV